MRRLPHALLAWLLVFPVDAAVNRLRLPVDGRWREYVHVPGGEDGWLTVYPLGSAQMASKAQQLRNRIALKLDDAPKAAEIARDYGLTALGPAKGAEGSGWWIFEGASPAVLAALGPLLMEDPRLTGVHFLLYRQRTRRFVPNDPQFPVQWHLQNTGQGGGRAGLDLNVTPAWERVKGNGIRIAIVDDGLQLTHPDLLPNVDTSNDHDWNDNTPDDPSPDAAQDFHGTACAGVAAGRGNNQLGISGTAPEATLVGLRLIAGPSSDAEEAEALAWKPQVIDIYSNSWGPDDDGRTLEEPGPLARAALANGAATGRNGKGSLFLFAAGNGRAEKDDSNYDGYANSIYTITVAALGNDGGATTYSEPGANILITAPSSGGSRDIVTTDLTGANGRNQSGKGGNLADTDYTNTFSGTSAACPMVAGCVALLLEANSSLGWRDVQEILIRSANKVNPSDPGWIRNGIGLFFHHDYGAGLLDADAAVELALTWSPRPLATSWTAEETGLVLPIPDHNSAGIVRNFQLPGPGLQMEHVTMRVDLRHPNRGQLNVTLTSPSGTVSRLASQHQDSGDDYQDWTFSTVRCWGENPMGVWSLQISDTVSGTSGTYRSATLTVHGTPAVSVNQPPLITSGAILSDLGAFTDMTLFLTGIASRDPEGDPVTLAYQWQSSSDNMLWTDLPAAAAATLSLDPGSSGNLVRCRIRASDGSLTSADWLTAPVAINRRPAQYARRGRVYYYDSDLFLPPDAGSPHYRFAPGSVMPGGLVLHPDTGVLEGTVDVPAGVYSIALERFATNGGIVSQSYPLYVSDPASDDEDPDHDRLNNLIEIALGLDPNQLSIPPTGVLQTDGTWLWSLSLPAAFTTPGHPTYALEYSTDLIIWQQSITSIVENNLTNAMTRLLTLQQRVPVNAGPGYVRLRATLP